jgi:hypothetical protein
MKNIPYITVHNVLDNTICNFETVSTVIKNENLNLLVVCFGGCCSNAFVSVLEKNGYNIMTPIYYNILCHCPQYIECNIQIIYLYDNPIKSVLSMKNRGNGIWDVNQQKLSNNKNIPLSDENLLKLMISQFNNWTNTERDNVLIIKSNELFEDDITTKLELFLNKKIVGMPMTYITPKTNLNNIIDDKLIELFEKYKTEIYNINNFGYITKY